MERPRILLVMEWYSREIHLGIADFARQSNWILDTQMRRGGHPPASWQGDGIICMLSPTSRLAEYVVRKNVPTVNLAWKDCPLDVPMVLHDDMAIGRMAAEHFISNGFKNLAFYRSEKLAVAFGRGEGFRKCVKKAKLNFISLDISARPAVKLNSPAWRQKWLVGQMEQLPKPLAIFAQNDDHAIELLYGCETAGISVPQEVAIVGCDNDELLCSLSSVQLSSVESNQVKLGYKAAERLDNIIHRHIKYKTPLLVKPSGVRIRKSSNVTAVNNPDVAQAMRFVNENAHRLITVADVVEACSVSRRKLYNEFAAELGYGISSAITRQRINIAKELLRNGKMKLYEISKKSGFANMQHMRNCFIRETNMSPLKFRNALASPTEPDAEKGR